MREIRTDEGVEEIEDDALKVLIHSRIEEYMEYVQHFSDLVRFVVVGPGDQLRDLEPVLGFEVANEQSDAFRGCDAFEAHPGYYELVYVLSDDGAGVIVFIEKSAGMAPEFLDICKQCQQESGT